MTHSRNIFIIGYFIILLLLAPINLLSFDTYYYWEWSRHLALSYYDGSPMIAYFIKLSTILFGDTLFALSLVGIVVAALTSVIIYKSARFFLTKEAAFTAMSLWLFSPLVTIDLLKQTTYDTPLTLFWALTLYATMRFIKFNNVRSLYFIGTCIGLMMLSKYSGIVLILSLFIFLITSPYRYLFKTPHFYLALLISMIIFSPVILWNYQHNWLSFIYQLTSHKLHDAGNPLANCISSFFFIFIPSLNFMLLPPSLSWLKRGDSSFYTDKVNHAQKDVLVKLCLIISTVFICFYLFAATKATIRGNWLAPYLISSALLGGFCFENCHYRKSIIFLILLYGFTSLGILLNNTVFFSLTTSKKLNYYRLIQAFNTSNPQLPKTVITSGWLEARMLFFLKNKRQVYTLNCGSAQNQYALWSSNIAINIKDKRLLETLYIDKVNRIECVEKYFDTCVRIHSPTELNQEETLYAYKCTNNK